MAGTKKSRIILIPALLIAMLFITGCDWLSFFMEIGCIFSADSAHCWQSAAVQGSDEEECEKIKPPEAFKSSGSNPPKDKCYLMIAQNTGNYDTCSKIKGGPGSYTKEECIQGIAVENVDPAGCRKLNGAALTACKNAISPLITGDKITDLDDKIKSTTDRLKDNPDDKELKDELNKLRNQRNDLLDFSASGVKSQYTKERIGEIMDDVEDDDVASEIRKEYIKYRSQNAGADIDQLMDKLEDIKQEKEFVKRADDLANQLVDDLKGKIDEYTDEKKQEMIDAATEKGWEWAKENSGDSLKYYLNRLEEMKGKYDKASEKYEEISGKIEKIKKAYDEVAAVYKKIDETNKLLAQGKIEKGHAEAIKGAILLGKGLEYATQYVPVFGSTISTISKETFDATVQLAKKRAQRTTAINKCIEDPENCDPNGISAY
jgi:uncharacterized coiled-coil DUF342 family protein